MNRFKITFTRNDNPKIYEFEVENLINGKTWKDIVRLNESSGHLTPIVREALSTYGFWLELLDFIGDNIVDVECNDIELLRYFYTQYRKQSSGIFQKELGRKHYWVFNKEVVGDKNVYPISSFSGLS